MGKKGGDTSGVGRELGLLKVKLVRKGPAGRKESNITGGERVLEKTKKKKGGVQKDAPIRI